MYIEKNIEDNNNNFEVLNDNLASNITNIEGINSDMYKTDFDAYIHPYINSNIYSDLIPVSIPFDTGIISDSYYNDSMMHSLAEEYSGQSEEQIINNPSDFIMQLPALSSALICCIITIYIYYRLFY